jgi:hypothetical protein
MGLFRFAAVATLGETAVVDMLGAGNGFSHAFPRAEQPATEEYTCAALFSLTATTPNPRIPPVVSPPYQVA